MTDPGTESAAEELSYEEARDRLVANVYVGGSDDAVGQLIDAFEQVIATQPIHDRLRDQKVRDWNTAVGRSLITPAEIAALEAAERAIAAVIEVDDFAPGALADPGHPGDPPRQAAPAVIKGAKPTPVSARIESAP